MVEDKEDEEEQTEESLVISFRTTTNRIESKRILNDDDDRESSGFEDFKEFAQILRTDSFMNSSKFCDVLVSAWVFSLFELGPPPPMI